ncbi:HU family DNA-binding protein [Nocardioides limicola]|uniref:HU family DNA-binding protein n=1 Tax=Nocardioides limicola TaxID=2803368 RepID=UPI00193C807E|nr:HU family DNA-binding protein [Nocardioides sp. DJM-14]
MTKDELVQGVANGAGLTQADADKAIKALTETIRAAVAGGDKVQIPGLGTFEPRERSARTGRNPQTGAEIKIAATTVPGFKAAAAFKTQVSGK